MNRTTLRGGVLKRLLGTAVFALASAGAAHAAVITFDGQSGAAFNRDSFQEAGYTVRFVEPADFPAPPGTVQIGRYIDGSNPSSCAPSICPTNGTGIFLDLFNTGYIDITANGNPFMFSGLDASFIAMANTEYPFFPAALQVFGFRADGSSEVIQFNITDNVEFQRFDAADVASGAEFAQQSFVELAIAGFACNAAGDCSGLDSSPGEIGLDNITLSDQPPAGNVPEPATASLLAFGLLGLGARLRRRS